MAEDQRPPIKDTNDDVLKRLDGEESVKETWEDKWRREKGLGPSESDIGGLRNGDNLLNKRPPIKDTNDDVLKRLDGEEPVSEADIDVMRNGDDLNRRLHGEGAVKETSGDVWRREQGLEPSELDIGDLDGGKSLVSDAYPVNETAGDRWRREKGLEPSELDIGDLDGGKNLMKEVLPTGPAINLKPEDFKKILAFMGDKKGVEGMVQDASGLDDIHLPHIEIGGAGIVTDAAQEIGKIAPVTGLSPK